MNFDARRTYSFFLLLYSTTTTTVTTTTSSTSTSTNKTMSDSRYQHLLTLIENGMQRVKKSLDTPQLVQDSYGEDASVFGGSDMLVDVMDGMIDKIQRTVKDDLTDYLQEQDVSSRLNKVDSIVAKLVESEAKLARADAEDRDSAKEALDETLLPEGVTLEDVLAFRNYERQKNLRDRLLEQLSKVKEEVAELEREQQETQDSVLEYNQHLQEVARELERSADVCSMVVSN